MNSSHLNVNNLADIAISALKNAYHECSDRAAKESIITASKAIILLYQDLDEYNRLDSTTESDNFDPSEYCSAV